MNGEVGEVRRLLASVVGSDIVDSLDDNELFFAHGIIDSLHLVEIVHRFESDLGIAVAGQDLSPEHFGSISGMALYLQTKRPL
jgi:acyl carrier protein